MSTNKESKDVHINTFCYNIVYYSKTPREKTEHDAFLFDAVALIVYMLL